MDAKLEIGGVEIETRSYGNLFATNDVVYDGMSVFVMCGLTGFRPQSYDFIKERCKPTEKTKGRMRLYERNDGVLVAYDCNADNHIYAGRESYDLLNDALSLLMEAGAKRVLMNGIRSREAPNPRITDANEVDTLQALIEWIRLHSNSSLEKVTCISGGGEFQRALELIRKSLHV